MDIVVLLYVETILIVSNLCGDRQGTELLCNQLSQLYKLVHLNKIIANFLFQEIKKKGVCSVLTLLNWHKAKSF